MLIQILKCIKMLSLKWDPGITQLTDVTWEKFMAEPRSCNGLILC